MPAAVRVLIDPRLALASKLAFLAGASYLFLPIDLIPDRTPWIGHLDEAAFLVCGSLAAYLLAPWPEPAVGEWWRGVQFRLRVLQVDTSNFFLLQHRDVDGFVISAKNSGSHWLKYMLSAALARKHGLEPPAHSTGRRAEDIVGHPSRPRRHAGIPRIATSHSIPSILLAPRWTGRLFRRPPVVVLVRDIEAALRSHLLKWQHEYATRFADYLALPPFAHRRAADLWWYVHFFNRWGDLARADPARVLVVRYEDLQAEPELWLRRIGAQLRLDFDDAAIAAALAYVDKAAIRALQDRGAGEVIVPDEGRPPVAVTAADRAVLRRLLSRYLRHDFGYAPPGG